MVKCSEQDLITAKFFNSSKGMKWLHNFAILNGVYVRLNNEWVLLDKLLVNCQKDIEFVLLDTKEELGRDVEDIDLLQQFVK